MSPIICCPNPNQCDPNSNTCTSKRRSPDNIWLRLLNHVRNFVLLLFFALSTVSNLALYSLFQRLCNPPPLSTSTSWTPRLPHTRRLPYQFHNILSALKWIALDTPTCDARLLLGPFSPPDAYPCPEDDGYDGATGAYAYANSYCAAGVY